MCSSDLGDFPGRVNYTVIVINFFPHKLRFGSKNPLNSPNCQAVQGHPVLWAEWAHPVAPSPGAGIW